MAEQIALDLDEIAACASAAAPGPWTAELIHHRPTPEEHDQPHWCWEVLDASGEDGEPEAFIRCIREDELDAAETATFISRARTLVPALVSEVRSLRAALADSQAETTRARDVANKNALKRLDALDALPAVPGDAETERGGVDAIEARAKAAAPARQDVPYLLTRLDEAGTSAHMADEACTEWRLRAERAEAERDRAVTALRGIAALHGPLTGENSAAEYMALVRHILNRGGIAQDAPDTTASEKIRVEAAQATDARNTVAAMSVALWDSLVAAMGDADDKRDDIAEVVAMLADCRDAQTVMRTIASRFGEHVYGRVLLFHIEACTPLRGDAEALAFPPSLRPLELFTVWGSAADRARFDAAVQAWRDAHPEAGTS